jgi:uncharacterized YccA/Bax inhibitor family protein
MRSTNPVLNAKTFENVRNAEGVPAMTLEGTVNRTAFLVLILMATATWTWIEAYIGSPIEGYLWIGGLGGLGVGLLTVFAPGIARFTAPVYAALEGLALGAISAIYEARFHGIVIQAVALTFGVMIALLVIYRARIIPVTENFKLGVCAATGAIAIFYIVALALQMWAGVRIGFLHEGSLLGIGFSLFVITIAALNLVLDFDFIEQGVEQGAPKHMEWYAAFGLVVTLIWLYVAILRLLAKLRSR